MKDDYLNTPDDNPHGDERIDRRDLFCECGEDATTEIDHGPDYAFWTGLPRRVPACAECAREHENRAPEPMTFDEALGRQCDEQMRIEAALKVKR